MSCKHEGGTDPCKRDNMRHCVVHHKQYSSKYSRMNVSSANLSASPSNAGEACEYFTLADCLARGLVVTKPLNRNTPDDLHIKCGGGWMTVQVKSARRNQRTGKLFAPCGAKIRSDIIALVFLPTQQIRYVANKREVPPELQTELTVLYGGNSSCHSSSTSAQAVPAGRSNKSMNVSAIHQTRRSTVTSAARRSKNSSGARQQNAAQASPAKETEA